MRQADKMSLYAFVLLSSWFSELDYTDLWIALEFSGIPLNVRLWFVNFGEGFFIVSRLLEHVSGSISVQERVLLEVGTLFRNNVIFEFYHIWSLLATITFDYSIQQNTYIWFLSRYYIKISLPKKSDLSRLVQRKFRRENYVFICGYLTGIAANHKCSH